MEKLIGRDAERRELYRCFESSKSEFVVLYGRRRIGKTFLVNQVFRGQFSFYFTGSHKAPKQRQLELFAKALRVYAHLDYLPLVDNWYHAFDALEQLIEAMPKAQKKVLFFDELPWIDTPNSEFVSALEDFWNTWAALRDDICFIACGSATSWIVDHLIENQGGLHNRITSRIYLRPFYLYECEQFVRMHGGTWDRYTLTQCYMYIGGVPYYWSLLDFGHDLPSNIDMLFFGTHAKLSGEFSELFQVLFRDAKVYIDIVRLLAEHREGMTRSELAACISNGGSLTARLENLQRCDFIMGYTPANNKKKGTIFRLVDFFTLFYFKFIEHARSQNREYWILKSSEPAVKSWQGLTFELICMAHSAQIIQRLGIAGILTKTYSWRSKQSDRQGKGAQIDLVIERTDHYIYLCEMKFSEEEYVITKDVEEVLRNKISVFRSETKTKKTLLLTMVTTYGVKQNIHSCVMQREVTMDDLFFPLLKIGR